MFTIPNVSLNGLASIRSVNVFFKSKVFWTLHLQLFISCLMLFLTCFVRYALFATMRCLESIQGTNRSRPKEIHCSFLSSLFFLFFIWVGLVSFSFSFCTRRFSQGLRQSPHSPWKFCLLKKPHHPSFYSKITWILTCVLLLKFECVYLWSLLLCLHLMLLLMPL